MLISYKMNNPKTLAILNEERIISNQNCDEFIKGFRQEAIKWIKKDIKYLGETLEKTMVIPKETRIIDLPGIRRWMGRLNITEEDLKKTTPKNTHIYSLTTASTLNDPDIYRGSGITLPVEATKAVEHAKRESSELDKVVKEITGTMAEERTLKNKAHDLMIKHVFTGISIGFAIGLIIGCLIGLEL